MSRFASDPAAVAGEGHEPLASRPIAGRPLRVTELSLGCAQLGNLYRAITDEQAHATIEAAWAQGIRYFLITDDNMARNKNWEAIFDRLIKMREVER